MSVFRMPQVNQGEIVLHKPGPNSTGWTPLFVTDAFADNISGVTLHSPLRPGGSDMKINVVHADDPRLQDAHFVHRMIEEGDMGVFVLHPFRLRMEAELERLKRQLESLTESLGGKSAKPARRPAPEEQTEPTAA